MKTIVQLVSKLKDYLLEKDIAAKQAVESNIAPVEADASSASKAYAAGKQLVLNDILYDVTASISIGDALEVGNNIVAANDLSTQIGGKQDQIEVTSMPTASASNVGKVYIYIGTTTSTYTSGQSYQSTLEDGSYIWKPTGAGATTAEAVSYDGTQSGSSETDVQGAIDDLYSQNETLETQIEDKLGSSDIANNLTTTTSGKVLDATQGKALNDAKADKTDLTSISETRPTASQAISKGKYFYLDGTLVKAKTAIAQGATFTENTNYETVNSGALNTLGGWKFFTSATGSVEKTGDIGIAKEIYVDLKYGGTGLWSSVIIPVDVLNEQYDVMVGFGSTYNAMAQIRAKITNGTLSVRIYNVNILNADETANTYWRVYTR